MAREPNNGGTAVAHRRELKDMIKAPETLEQIKRVIPPKLGEKVAERFVSVALTYSENEDILACNPRTVVKSIVEAAQLGIEVGGPRKHAHLVKFGTEATLMIGFQGLIYLGVREGVIRSARAHAVYPCDEFYVELGSREEIIHRPSLTSDRNQEDMTHVYAVVGLPDGTEKFDFMTRAQVEKIRLRAKSKDSPAWKGSYDEMARKVILKRLFKTVPMGDEMQESHLARAIQKDNENDFDFTDDEMQHASAVSGERTRERLVSLRDRMGAAGRNLDDRDSGPFGDEPPPREQVGEEVRNAEPQRDESGEPKNLKSARQALKATLAAADIDEYEIGFNDFVAQYSDGKTEVADLNTAEIAAIIRAVEHGSRPKDPARK